MPIFGIDTIPFLASSFDDAKKLWQARKAAIEQEARRAGHDAAVRGAVAAAGASTPRRTSTRSTTSRASRCAPTTSAPRASPSWWARRRVTIQAAELPQALATGVVNAFMTSGATGYDSKVWETMTHFYDMQAWIPKNVIFVNKAAFAALDKPTQEARAEGRRRCRGARLEERGRRRPTGTSTQLASQGHEGAAAEPGAWRPASRRSASSSPPTGSPRPAPTARPWSTRIRKCDRRDRAERSGREAAPGSAAARLPSRPECDIRADLPPVFGSPIPAKSLLY